MLKKIFLLSSFLSCVSAFNALAVECTSVPSCTSLGYKPISSCAGTTVKRPFDANYGICITDSSCNAITKYTGTLSYPISISSLVKSVNAKCTYGLCPSEKLRDMLSNQSGILLTDEDFAHNIYNGGMVSTTDVLLANKNIYYACRKAPTLKCRVGDYLNIPTGGTKSCSKKDEGQNYRVIKNDGQYVYYTNNTVELKEIKGLSGSYSYADLYKSAGGCIIISSDDLKRLEQGKLFDLFNNNTVEVMVKDYILMGGVQLVSKHSSGTPSCCTSAMAFGTNATGFAILCKGVGRVKLSSSGDPTGTNETNYTATYISGVNPYPAQQFSPVVSSGK